MKKLIPFVGIAFVVSVGLLSQIGTTLEVNKIETEEVIKEVEVDSLEKRIKDAQEAEMGEIEASAQAAYEAVKEEKLLEISDRVKAEVIAEIESTISSEEY